MHKKHHEDYASIMLRVFFKLFKISLTVKPQPLLLKIYKVVESSLLWLLLSISEEVPGAAVTTILAPVVQKMPETKTSGSLQPL